MSLPLLADFATTPMFLEAVMLACFGIAWPVANVRMLRTGNPEGKGLAFTTIILAGYLAGAGAKVALLTESAPLAQIFWFYMINAASVSANIFLQCYLRSPSRAKRDITTKIAVTT